MKRGHIEMEYTTLSNNSGGGKNPERYNSNLYTRNIDIIGCICASLGGAANIVSICALRASSIKKKRSGRLLINLACSNVIFCFILMLYDALDAARWTAEMHSGINSTMFQSDFANGYDVDVTSERTTTLYDVTFENEYGGNDVKIWHDSGPLSCLYYFSVALEWIRELFPFLATTWLVVDQFMGVAFPLRQGLIFTPKVVTLLIISTYVIPLVYLTVSTVTDVANQIKIDCTVIFFNRYRHMEYLDPHFVASGIFVATVFLTNLVLYLLLMVIVRRQRVQLKHTKNHQSKIGEKDGSNVYIIVGLLFCTLFVFWSPMVVLYFLTIFDKGSIEQSVTDTVAFITVLNPLADAVVYGARLEQVRKAYSSFFKKIMQRCSCKK